MTAMPERDRDAVGRPRNSRPRDGLGRPLPRGSAAGVDGVPAELAMPLDDAVALAQRYLDTDRPFHAHEVFEALWKSRPVDERDLWQGLAQIAVGLTHALRGNTTGARTLLERGGDRVARYAGDPHGIAINDVVAASRGFVDSIGAAALDVRPKNFRLRVRTLT
jgi:uncharacterized protein